MFWKRGKRWGCTLPCMKESASFNNAINPKFLMRMQLMHRWMKLIKRLNVTLSVQQGYVNHTILCTFIHHCPSTGETTLGNMDKCTAWMQDTVWSGKNCPRRFSNSMFSNWHKSHFLHQIIFFMLSNFQDHITRVTWYMILNQMSFMAHKMFVNSF